MTKKIRWVILLVSAVLFLVIMPYILLYSLGYRVDFENRKIVTTGGIYVRVLPQGANVIIDSKIENKTGLFSNSVFVQNLLPKPHAILITKDGYYDYQKTLPVKENEVTKLEHVLLFKKNIVFDVMADKSQSPFNPPAADSFTIKNGGLYYANVPANANLSPSQKNIPVIKNIVAYKVLDNRITWLGTDGFLYSSDLAGKNPQKLSKIKLTINLANTYEIFAFNQRIFLKENNTALLFDQDAKAFKNFHSPVTDIKSSPNDQRLLYYNDHEILYSDISQLNERIFLNRFSETILDAYWLNDDYIIFQLGDPPSLNASAGQSKILISEIDVQDHVNIVELPQTVSLTNGAAVDLENIKISFIQQDKTLYIFNQDKVLVSERLIP